MARNDPMFARVDISLMFNPQFRKLSGTQKWFYLACYLSAVEARSEQLPPAFDLAAIRDRAGIDTKTARKCLEKSLEVGLIKQTPEGWICVSGVRENHPKLTWNEASQAAPHPPRTGHMRGDERDREPREEARIPAPATQATEGKLLNHGKNKTILPKPEMAVKVLLEDYGSFCKFDVTSIASTMTGTNTGPGMGFFTKQLRTLESRVGSEIASEIFREMLFRYWSELKSGEPMDNIGAGLTVRIKKIVEEKN